MYLTQVGKANQKGGWYHARNFERGYRCGFLQQVYHAALNLASTELRWDLERRMSQ
jgi:hypothetical protein